MMDLELPLSVDNALKFASSAPVISYEHIPLFIDGEEAVQHIARMVHLILGK